METPDTIAIVQPMTSSIQTIGQHFQLLQDQVSSLSAIDSISEDGTNELRKMREELCSHQMKATQEALELKSMAKDIAPDVRARLRLGIKERVQAAIRMETETQVNRQITEYVPVPLAQEIADTKKRLNDVRIALENSEARAQNSSLDLNHHGYEQLAPVLNNSGHRSAFYPADFESLLSYDAESLRELLCSYGLEVDDDMKSNVSRFLRFIGANYEI